MADGDIALRDNGTPDGDISLSAAAAAANPPFRSKAILFSILATWALTVATPVFATVGLQSGPVVQPPKRSEITQQIIRQSWNPQPQVVQPRKFVPQVQADQRVPFTRLPAQILASWQPTQAGPLWRSVGLQDGPVVQPPVHNEQTQAIIRQSWEPTPRAYEPRRVVPQVPVVERVPFSRLSSSILESWQPRQAGPLWRSVGVQDGPVVQPPVRHTNIEIALQSWIQQAQPSQPRRFVKPAAVVADNPPPSSHVNQLIIARTWDPPTVSPLWRGVGLQDGPSVQQGDTPPILHRLWLDTVLASWEPGPKRPVWFNRIIDLSTQPIQTRERLYQILSTWHHGPPVQQRRPVVTPSGIEPDSHPYLDRATQRIILATWEPGPIVWQRRPVVTASAPPTPNLDKLLYDVDTGIWYMRLNATSIEMIRIT